LGLLLALWSAALSAIFSILNSQFTKVHEPLTITFYEMVGACLVCILFFPIYSVYLSDHGQLVLALSLADFLYLSILAVVCTVYAFYVGVEIMKRLSAFQVNLTINLEPVYGIILAVMIFGEKEKMSPGFYYGALVILLSIFVYPLLNKFLPKWERYKAGVLKR
jgi:drug/metabolite transporter (DMT)-like permease